MKTTLELLRERLLKDKEIFPHYNEYINGILYDIDNELLAMEKEQKIKFAFDFYYDFSNQLGVPFNLISENRLNAEQYYNETFKSE